MLLILILPYLFPTEVGKDLLLINSSNINLFHLNQNVLFQQCFLYAFEWRTLAVILGSHVFSIWNQDSEWEKAAEESLEKLLSANSPQI
jgi:hypothetical protein